MSAIVSSMLGAFQNCMACESKIINSDIDHDLRNNNVSRQGHSRSYKCCRCFSGPQR